MRLLQLHGFAANLPKKQSDLAICALQNALLRYSRLDLPYCTVSTLFAARLLVFCTCGHFVNSDYYGDSLLTTLSAADI